MRIAAGRGTGNPSIGAAAMRVLTCAEAYSPFSEDVNFVPVLAGWAAGGQRAAAEASFE
ncbi:MAG TPA: hypothetical protein VNT28_00575 [Candidatus Limnocylindrales bacterium]|jgi:hypothetical protein|nr:hypothetical protein [Candidatus Limnocylindrales bacterium]